MTRYSSHPTSIRLAPKLKKRLTVMADKREQTLAGLIVHVLMDWLEQNEKKKAQMGGEERQ